MTNIKTNQQRGRMSKRKGKNGELELSHALNDYGYSTYRTVQCNGRSDKGSADLVGLKGIHIECKRVEHLNIVDAMDQAKRDAKDGNIPTVFHRRNNCEWLVTMRLEDWIRLYANGEE
jgi:hypothetical protein